MGRQITWSTCAQLKAKGALREGEETSNMILTTIDLLIMATRQALLVGWSPARVERVLGRAKIPFLIWTIIGAQVTVVATAGEETAMAGKGKTMMTDGTSTTMTV